MSQASETLIRILEAEGKTLHVGTVATLLEKAHVIWPYQMRWEIDSKEERAYWNKVQEIIDEAIKTGKVGTFMKNRSIILFLAVRVREEDQQAMTLRHHTEDRPYVGFLAKQGKVEFAGTFATEKAAENWWEVQDGFCRVYTVNLSLGVDKVSLVFSK